MQITPVRMVIDQNADKFNNDGFKKSILTLHLPGDIQGSTFYIIDFFIFSKFFTPGKFAGVIDN